ncbi:MAG: GNAT family N-acetyltransferase [Oscillospiraceae bacterium]|nr:GNAT family N-acetyltransferase [Oscillospiraceae bacterium]
MFTVMLQEENQQAFTRYIPKELRGELKKPETISFGAVNNDNTSAGVLMARVVSGWLEIIWFYIDGQFRRKGLGRALLGNMLSCFDFVPELTGVFAQFPEKNNEGLKELFESAGYKFEEGGRSVFELSLKDLTENKFWSKEPSSAENVVMLKDVFDINLRDFEVKLSLTDAGVPLETPLNRKIYDENLSAAYIKNGKIEGILLIEKEENGSIFLSFAYVSPGENSALPAMLYKSGRKAVDTLPPETKISLAAITDVSARLTEKLFPGRAAEPTVYAVYRVNDVQDSSDYQIPEEEEGFDNV